MIAGDTIAAISSAVGASARMIVRMSGPEAHRIAREIVAEEMGSPSVGFATIRFAELEFRGWVYSFASPRSYTGEDSVEFHIPGNPLLAKLLIAELLRLGAREAEPGEFTARAYFNGRMDLAQAEGVAATISAASDAELRAGRKLLGGELAKRLEPAMSELADLLALIEAGIDFSEEDISFISSTELQKRVDRIDATLANLLADSVRFERLHHIPQFVLVGRPNAGKSTLLNALAGEDRAIVSPIAGTTRDALSAQINLSRGMIQLIDVAGLETEDAASIAGQSAAAQIAQQMQQRAIQMMQKADRVILVRDCTDDQPNPSLPRDPDLIVFTKADLGNDSRDHLCVSAVSGLNLDQLRMQLDSLAFGKSADASLAINARHVQLICDAQASLTAAREAMDAGLEMVALELREALNLLGGILGQISPDDVLGRVFSSFCIGK
jgi:tRNA modification GTPase